MTIPPEASDSMSGDARFHQDAFAFFNVLLDALGIPENLSEATERSYYNVLEGRVSAVISALKAVVPGPLDDTLPDQIAALRERIAQVPTAYEHESYGKGTLPPWVQAPSGRIQDQMADFLNVLLDSLEIPQPATKSDRPVYEDVLDRRTFNAVLALTGILGFGPDELPESTNYLREVTEDFPVDGYHHA